MTVATVLVASLLVTGAMNPFNIMAAPADDRQGVAGGTRETENPDKPANIIGFGLKLITAEDEPRPQPLKGRVTPGGIEKQVEVASASVSIVKEELLPLQSVKIVSDVMLNNSVVSNEINRDVNTALCAMLNKGSYVFEENTQRFIFSVTPTELATLRFSKDASSKQTYQESPDATPTSGNPTPTGVSAGVIASQTMQSSWAVNELSTLEFTQEGANTVGVRFKDLVSYLKSQGGEVQEDSLLEHARNKTTIALLQNAATTRADKERELTEAREKQVLAEKTLKKTVKNGKKMSGYTADLRVTTELTEEQVEKNLRGRLAGRADQLLALEKEYDVNIGFIVAVATAETGQGEAGYGKTRANIFNIRNGSGEYISYEKEADPVGASLRSFCKLISNEYLNESGSYFNGYSVYDVHTLYAESPRWGEVVSGSVDEFYRSALSV